jgi:ABC-type molybdate transport system substrate-binding protein
MTRIIIAILLVLALAGGLLLLVRPGSGAGGPVPSRAIVVHCAAGLRTPAETAAAAFTAATGIAVRFQFGGSGQLLGSLSGGAPGDLFLAGDASYIRLGAEKQVIGEVLPLAEQRPVIAVPAGNPKGIHSLADLKGLRYGLPNPEAASLGRTLKDGLGPAWNTLAAGAAVTKPTVTDLVTDLQVGGLDAIILWDAITTQVPGLQAVAAPELAPLRETLTIGVCSRAEEPAAALAFARWLASPEHGAPVWTAKGYRALPGDAWAMRPNLTLYSGGVNRLGVEAGLKRFAEREGVEITTVFNGCGILCADMKQLARSPGAAMPDAYYACDLCFVPPVADLFPEAVLITETDIVLAVAKGNPKGVRTLADLAQPGLTVGLCNAEQSTLGYMTKRMLAQAGLEKAVMANVRSQVPTADLLVNQLRTGSIDAAVIYAVNAKPQAATIEAITIDLPGAKAIQPFAVAAKSPRAQLAHRLLDHLKASRSDFESKGFRWRGDAPPVESRTLDPDPASRVRP